MTQKYQLQTVARALDCLSLIEQSAVALSLTEISEAMRESTAIVYRMVCTLEAKGYLHRRSSDKRYAYTGRSMGSGAVTRAIDLLHAIAGVAPDGCDVATLARIAELDEHIVRELLVPLADKGLIESVGDSGQWRLSFSLVSLVRPLLNGDDLIAFIQPLMERLHAETGETVSLFYRVRSSQVVAMVMPSQHPVRYSLEVGHSFPLYLGAAGKAALAAMPDREADDLLDECRLDNLTTYNPTKAALQAELAMIRDRGYAISSGERVEGASAVAAAVLDESSQPRAVLGLMMPAFRISREKLEELGERLISELHALPVPARGSASPISDRKTSGF